MSDNSIYVLLAGESALFRQLDVAANNSANVSTLGFKGREMVFQQMLVKEAPNKKLAFPNDIATPRNLAPGSLKATYQPFDAAIKGDGYFVVQTPSGNRYTRAGTFREVGGLVATQDGHPLLMKGDQVIQAPEDANSFIIAPDGTVSAAGNTVGQLQIVHFEKESALENIGNNLLSTKETPKETAEYALVQGVLEESNVNPILQIQQVVQLQRYLTGISNLMNTYGQTKQKAINMLAKVKV